MYKALAFPLQNPPEEGTMGNSYILLCEQVVF